MLAVTDFVIVTDRRVVVVAGLQIDHVEDLMRYRCHVSGRSAGRSAAAAMYHSGRMLDLEFREFMTGTCRYKRPVLFEGVFSQQLYAQRLLPPGLVDGRDHDDE